MNYRTIGLGLAGLLLVAICVGVIVLMSLTGGSLFGPDEAPQSIKIATVGPLFTPVVFITQEPNSPPEAEAAAIRQSPVTATPTPIATATDMPSPTATSTPRATPTPTPAQQSGFGTRVVISRLNLDRPIIFAPIENETWRVDHLGQSVGYLEGTAPPGSNSNLVLAAHVSFETGEYGPFAGLAQLAAGDVVTVHDGDEVFNYVIDGLHIVDRLNIEVVYPTETGQITLITCTNWDNSQGRYDDRVVVSGHLVEE